LGKPNAPDVTPSRQFISIWKRGQAAIAGLKTREWACDCCGVIHDRDINASKNILRIGQDALAVGASQLNQGRFETPCFRNNLAL